MAEPWRWRRQAWRDSLYPLAGLLAVPGSAASALAFARLALGALRRPRTAAVDQHWAEAEAEAEAEAQAWKTALLADQAAWTACTSDSEGE